MFSGHHCLSNINSAAPPSMVSRKRPAVDALPRRSPKLQRTSRDADDPDSYHIHIRARWMLLARDFIRLSVDTLASLAQGGPSNTSEGPNAPSSSTSVPSPPHPSPKPPPATDSAHAPRSPLHSRQSSQSTPKLEYPPSSSSLKFPPSNTPSRDSSLDNLPPIDRLRIAPSSSDFSFNLSNYTPYPEIDEAFSKVRSKQFKDTAVRRPYKNREHIYAQVHKSKVIADKTKLRQELVKRLYETKQRQGFTSGFADFEGLLEYQYKLEKIAQTDSGHRAARGPLFPFGDIRSAAKPSKLPTEDDSTKFLQLALDKAQATLKTPRPPKPFIPTLEQLKLSHRAKDEELERRIRPPRPALPTSLPPEDEAKVKSFLNKRGIVAKYAREQVSDQDLSRLRPGQWLNDEIINFYGAMILGRSEACKENPGANGKSKPLNVHYFSTFFWPKLVKEGYEKGRLAKWTKKIDLLSKDVVLIPVNHSNAHWTAAAINFRQKRFESYDSMDMAKEVVFKQLRLYVDAEHRNKKKKPFDFTGWEDWAPESTPQQENGYDCGVFTCQFMEYLSRGEESFNFSQKDMPYLRQRMIWEIGNSTLRDNS